MRRRWWRTGTAAPGHQDADLGRQAGNIAGPAAGRRDIGRGDIGRHIGRYGTGNGCRRFAGTGLDDAPGAVRAPAADRIAAYCLEPTSDPYQDFLTLWKDADSDIPVLKQAHAEYSKLK